MAAVKGLTLIVLVAVAAGTLSVYNLQALGQEAPALLDIQYSIANFGFVPYRQSHADTARQ